MKPKNSLLVLIGVLLIGAVGYGVYDFVLGPTLQPSSTMTPIPIVTIEPQVTEAMPAPEMTQPVVEMPSATAEDMAASPSEIVFRIVPEESQASFNIYEELRGSPKDVIGSTDQVSGEILVNLDDLSQSQVGMIQVNARALATDDQRRNQAIRNRILMTDSYEFITFKPLEIIGLSGKGEVGQTYQFQIKGELTIRDVTQLVTFDVELTAESLERVSGMATAVVRYKDFGIVVPDVPFVANVGDEVKLELKFVAVSE